MLFANDSSAPVSKLVVVISDPAVVRLCRGCTGLGGGGGVVSLRDAKPCFIRSFISRILR